MGRYNLLEEPWISVIKINDGQQTKVSLTDIFKHASEYRCLAGDMKTQDFAVLRVLLAVLQTVFSRYDCHGNPLVTVDDKMRQIEIVEDDEDEYEDAMQENWDEIYHNGYFPDVLYQYLNIWKDRFYLFDEDYPFYQISEQTLKKILPKGKKPTEINGRFMNRTISESNNKIALFSPRDGVKKKDKNKDIMVASELARWLITFQNYTGLSDKVSLVDKSKGQNPSRGWLFDLGGIVLEGDNLFETLMMNYIDIHPEEQYRCTIQKPCWEYKDEEVIDRLLKEKPIDNLAELYTNWSRGIYLSPKTKVPGSVSIGIVKLPSIRHVDMFLEPMTLWNYNKTGDNKDHYTPRKHRPDQAMWRNFGLIALPSTIEKDKERKQPGIQERMNVIGHKIGYKMITILAISMKDDGNATSWVPVDEINDQLKLNDLVLTDEKDQGWVIRISDTVDEIKDVIENYYRMFLRNITEIRGFSNNNSAREAFIGEEVKSLYQEIDLPFREWLYDIKPDASKEKKILEWRKVFKQIVLKHAENFVYEAGPRDLKGIKKDDRTKNIFTAYLMFKNIINKKLEV